MSDEAVVTCRKCRSSFGLCAIGNCVECGADIPYCNYKLCDDCSIKLDQCTLCRCTVKNQPPEDPNEVKSYFVEFDPWPDGDFKYTGTREQRIAQRDAVLAKRVPWFTKLVTDAGLTEIVYTAESIGTTYADVKCNSKVAKQLAKLPGITDVCES